MRLSSSSSRQIIVADRSPLSAVFYSRSHGLLLEPLIRQYTADLAATAGVTVVTAHLRTPRPLLWDRIQSRLRAEPHRLALKEDRCGS